MGRFDALTQLDQKPKKVTSHDKKSASPQVDMSASGQVNTPAQGKAERYTTRLQPHLVKSIKRYAFEHDMNDYDVVCWQIVGFVLLCQMNQSTTVLWQAQDLVSVCELP